MLTAYGISTLPPTIKHFHLAVAVSQLPSNHQMPRDCVSPTFAKTHDARCARHCKSRNNGPLADKFSVSRPTAKPLQAAIRLHAPEPRTGDSTSRANAVIDAPPRCLAQPCSFPFGKHDVQLFFRRQSHLITVWQRSADTFRHRPAKCRRRFPICHYTKRTFIRKRRL